MNVTSLYIEITNQCNLDCRSCYNRSGRNRQTAELSAGQLEHALKLFLPYGLKRFLLSGGEPSLHTEFDSILDLVDKYPDMSFGIVTNGTNPASKLIHYLNTRDNLTLQLSLDGSCEEQNAKTRGAGHFAQALFFAGQIQQRNPRPLLKMVVSRRNLADVEDFCRLALSLHFTPKFSFLLNSGNGSDSWDEERLTPQQKLMVLKQVDAFNQKYHAAASLPVCTSTCPYVNGIHDLNLYIRVDGSIQPCQMLCDKAFTLGNVLSFDKAYFLQKLNDLSRLAVKRSRQDFGCAKCLLAHSCGRGCMAEAFLLHQDPLSCDENCQERKLQFLYQINPRLS